MVSLPFPKTYQGLHSRNQTLASLETKAFFARVFGGDETLEGVGPDHTIEDHGLLFSGVLVRFGDFDTLADPVAALPVGDVDVLDTDGAAWFARGVCTREGSVNIGRKYKSA
jgi:hypothetical protein